MQAKKYEKHGMEKTRLYRIWCNMKSRCYAKCNKTNSAYGAKGITVCDEWKNSFITFKNWAINNGYTDDLSIDRINNDGNYEPSNCRWVGRHTQLRNTSRNVYVSFKGVDMVATDVAKDVGINKRTLFKRLQNGMEIEQAVLKSDFREYEIEFNGETLNLTQWADKIGLSIDGLRKRFKKGWSLERALTTPNRNKNNKSNKRNNLRDLANNMCEYAKEVSK